MYQNNNLQEDIDSELGKKNISKIEIPDTITKNIKNILRHYQVNAIQYFLAYLKDYNKNSNKHLMFNMATGSGKTLIMASLMLYLYELGYRNFLFFVNSNNIVGKTRENFFNYSSIKYLFSDTITIKGQVVEIKEVNSFNDYDDYSVNLFVTSIQYLHNLLNESKENAFDIGSLQDKKIVIFADEAHHFNAQTKKEKLSQKTLFKNNDEQTTSKLSTDSWEETVKKIFNQNKDNFLLEFTATIEYENKAIAEKYKPITIFNYDLLEYRKDLYSKEIDIIQNDVDRKYLMLGAVILSEYRRAIARDNNIELKPIILFKANKTIKESEENQKVFIELIQNLTEKDIDKLSGNEKNDIIAKAINYFREKYKDFNIFINSIKESFKIDYQLTTNEKEKSSNNNKAIKEFDKQNKLLNNLESKDNPIRVIFSVNKLNEGWDVLNLFDIVRLYDTRVVDTKKKSVGKSTISEAQLIGRGARYYPLKIDFKNEDEIYKRKYDKNLDNPKRILETLYYHSVKNSRYISELKSVLKEYGLMEDRKYKDISFKLKDKLNKYSENNYIFSNRKEEKINRIKEKTLFNRKSYESIYSNLSKIDFSHTCKTYQRKVEHAINDSDLTESDKFKNNIIESSGEFGLKYFKDIPYYIKINAWYKQNYNFEKLKSKFSDIESVKDLFEAIGDIQIKFYNLNINGVDLNEEFSIFLNENFYPTLIKILNEEYSEYYGTKEFYPNKIKDIFGKTKLKRVYDKSLIIEESYMDRKEFYAQNILVADSELEMDFATKHTEEVIEYLRNKGYKNIYLFRNDQDLAIYNFEDGQAFYPDFILVCEYENKLMHYQIFIEPKGEYIKYSPKEQIKEKLLLSLEKEAVLEKDSFALDTDKYILFGMRFFTDKDKPADWNNELRIKFKDD